MKLAFYSVLIACMVCISDTVIQAKDLSEQTQNYTWLSTQTMPVYIYQTETISKNTVIEFNPGHVFTSENVDSGLFWELRGGQSNNYEYGIRGAWFVGFSNYLGESVPGPDRLLSGDLDLRTLSLDKEASIPIPYTPIKFKMGTGIGWTWVAHSPDKMTNGLAAYEPDEKVLAVSERVHDNFSFAFRTGLDYEIKENFIIGLGARYFVMHTFRERDVLIYKEDYSKRYADRYENYHSAAGITMDHWSLLLSLKFMFR